MSSKQRAALRHLHGQVEDGVDPDRHADEHLGEAAGGAYRLPGVGSCRRKPDTNGKKSSIAAGNKTQFGQVEDP